MSVIIESQPGDELILIEQFSGSPQGVVPSRETSRMFRIGERVRYVSSFREEHYKDHPVGWMVVFDASDGKRYSATQTLFVTEDCWQGLKKFFKKRATRKATARSTQRR